MAARLPDPGTSTLVENALSAGSCWHRWEPHIHGPGTVLNDQFKGSDAFNQYIAALERALPVMKAIGVTDYYSTEVYEAVVEAKKNGRLPQSDLIFPNIEMRLSTATVRGSWVNLHLLVNPEDPNHLIELKRFLARIHFEAFGDKFSCTKDDLIRLGKKANPEVLDDHRALQIGSVQFKVSREQLQHEFRACDWAKGNILLAVAGGSDGTSGVKSAADTTLREEIEKAAHIVFASSDNQREFWLGKKSLTGAQIEERYGGLKPCMHGSDAHKHEDVGAPMADRYTWIKGIAKFDSLIQACIDPEGRAYIGTHAPLGATPSQVIQRITINDTAWCATPLINLNAGLVAVIGARGSGKTALAEIIAAGCDSITDHKSLEEKSKSFLNRAKSELQGSTVSVLWGADRREVSRSLNNTGPTADSYPMARYLSQQFVDDLCSSDGVTDKLLTELERIIFAAHDINQREGTVDFSALLELKASRPRSARSREEKSLQDLCDRLGQEFDKTSLVEETKKQIELKEELIKQYQTDRAKLVVKEGEERIKRLNDLTSAADKVRSYVRYYGQQEQSLLGLQDEIKNVRQSRAPEDLREMQASHTTAHLSSEEWKSFLIDFVGEVDTILSAKLAAARKSSQVWKGVTPLPSTEIALDAELDRLSLAVLEAEITRVTKLVSTDKDTTQKYQAISQKITQEQSLLEKLKLSLTDFKGAKERATNLRKERDESYGRVFQVLLQEEAILKDLYSPIMTRLSAAKGTLYKMAFSIKRNVDLDKWANAGEQLFDLREIGPFKGKGTLKSLAEKILLPAWETGDVASVLEAMKTFRAETDEPFMQMSKVPRTDKQKFRSWGMQFAKWLYSTDHIRIIYNVDYDGVDIRKLSPGTRGIVLLLLYLALDEEDDRPLIIDQPEENLDPKSIFDELVSLFVLAKKKRQVIIVTHNANLVVNTDAEQIIIARTGYRLPSGMPIISYVSGGLEESQIRTEVCAILEGGEEAFKKRAKRLRVSMT